MCHLNHCIGSSGDRLLICAQLHKSFPHTIYKNVSFSYEDQILTKWMCPNLQSENLDTLLIVFNLVHLLGKLINWISMNLFQWILPADYCSWCVPPTFHRLQWPRFVHKSVTKWVILPGYWMRLHLYSSYSMLLNLKSKSHI